MSRRIRPRTYAVAGGALLLALVLSLTVGPWGRSTEAPPPGAIEKIVAKNRAAAMTAAAAQRAESAKAAQAADLALDRRDAQAVAAD